MKILGGKYKGRNFYMPKDIRPTQNVARQALFDLLGHDLKGFSFLDLFAGSGAVGLEAISRGASEVVFVEKDSKNIDIITKNVGLLQIDFREEHAKIEVLAMDAFAALKELSRKKRLFDIVFIDPPYHRELAKKALKQLEAHVIVHPNSTLIFQHDQKEELPEVSGSFRLYRRKKYGQSDYSIYYIDARLT